MSDFETIKATLKDKWLDYYEVNRSWIVVVIESRASTQGGTRPHASFILGVITALETKLKDFFYHFSLVTKDQLAVLNALDLNFDPQRELEKRAEERKIAQEATLIEGSNIIGLLSEDPEYLEVHQGLEEIRSQIRQQENSS